MPTLTNADALVNAANDLKLSLEGGIPQTDENKNVLNKFVEIFKENAKAYQEETAVSQRVHKAAQKQRVRRLAAKNRQQKSAKETPSPTTPNENEVQIPVVSPDDDEVQTPRLRHRRKEGDNPSPSNRINVIPPDDEAPA